MKRVYKYVVPLTDTFTKVWPEFTQPLTVETQRGEPCMWALIDDEQRLVEQEFRLAGTGHAITEDDLIYVGTFQLEGGALVFHLFQCGFPRPHGNG